MTEDLPTDWLISNEELKALKKYILYRAQHLNEEKCLRLSGLRLFRLSDLVETHKDSLYGKPLSESSSRHYSRQNPYNQKCLKQTVFRLPDGGNNEAA